jgi:hypothetical protein
MREQAVVRTGELLTQRLGFRHATGGPYRLQ